MVLGILGFKPITKNPILHKQKTILYSFVILNSITVFPNLNEFLLLGGIKSAAVMKSKLLYNRHASLGDINKDCKFMIKIRFY